MAAQKRFMELLEKNISKCEKTIKEAEGRVGFKTKADNDNIESIRRLKEDVTLLKEFGEQLEILEIENVSKIMSLLAVQKMLQELKTEDQMWANFFQELVLLCKKIDKKDFSDTDKLKNIFKI